MRFRISGRGVFVALTVFCFSALYIGLVLRQDCLPSNVATVTDVVWSTDHPFADDSWVLDCITWDRIRSKPKPEDVVLQDFGSNRTFAGGESPRQRRLFFHRIFAARDWPADDPSYRGLKASGPGAMLRNAQNAIAALHSVISRVKSHLGKSTVSLLDVPCGDLQWIRHVLDARADILYTGADIVPDIIAHHRKTFKTLRKAEFIELDVVSMPLNHTYDIILVRDLLQHLWMVDAVTALKRLSDSGSRFLLATTVPDTAVNEDVNKLALGGRKSSYNLERSPFSLESPMCSSYDWNVEHISLWNLPLKQIL